MQYKCSIMRLQDRRRLCLKRLLIQGEVAVKVHRIRRLICSLINRGYDMFPFTMDIQGIVSTHVEVASLLQKQNA